MGCGMSAAVPPVAPGPEAAPLGEPLPEFGSFKCYEVIGRGSFGNVYRGAHRGVGSSVQTVAVKTILKNQRRYNARLIKSEVDVMLSINHPGCIKLVAFHDDIEASHLVMEYAAGGDLLDRLRASGPLPERDAVEIHVQVLQALVYLHAHGICHRDIKPENILLVHKQTKEGPNSNLVRLTDFGMSCVHTDITQDVMSELSGTPEFAAPELMSLAVSVRKGERGALETQKYSCLVDVWAAGVVLYVLLSARAPFSTRHGNTAMIQKIIEGRFEFRGSVWQRLSAHATDVILMMMTPDPKRRPTAAACLMHPFFVARGSSGDSEELLKLGAGVGGTWDEEGSVHSGPTQPNSLVARHNASFSRITASASFGAPQAAHAMCGEQPLSFGVASSHSGPPSGPPSDPRSLAAMSGATTPQRLTQIDLMNLGGSSFSSRGSKGGPLSHAGAFDRSVSMGSNSSAATDLQWSSGTGVAMLPPHKAPQTHRVSLIPEHQIEYASSAERVSSSDEAGGWREEVGDDPAPEHSDAVRGGGGGGEWGGVSSLLAYYGAEGGAAGGAGAGAAEGGAWGGGGRDKWEGGGEAAPLSEPLSGGPSSGGGAAGKVELEVPTNSLESMASSYAFTSKSHLSRVTEASCAGSVGGSVGEIGSPFQRVRSVGGTSSSNNYKGSRDSSLAPLSG